MEVKEAVSKAKKWLAETLNDEDISNLGLEEVEFHDGENAWKVTLGFSRPWNSARNALSAVTGEKIPRRAYRVLTVDDRTGKVISMRKSSAGD
ncbi:MAG: hypothetical protein K2Y27_35395 [Xanthobacteraceae bacterium]|nr:hypothetical protein [Xanthobacteraceae bacterium]